MGIKVNLSGVEAWSGSTVLSPGSHNVRVTEAREATAGTGTPQIELSMEAIDGAEAGGAIRDWIAVTERSLGRVRMIMEAFRIQIPDGDFELSAQSFVGKTARIVVRSEPGRKDPSKTFSKVAAYELMDGAAGGGFAGDPLDQVDDQRPVPVSAGDDPMDSIPF